MPQSEITPFHHILLMMTVLIWAGVFPTAQLIKVGSSLYAGCIVPARYGRPVLYGGFQVIPAERCQREVLHQPAPSAARLREDIKKKVF